PNALPRQRAIGRAPEIVHRSTTADHEHARAQFVAIPSEEEPCLHGAVSFARQQPLHEVGRWDSRKPFTLLTLSQSAKNDLTSSDRSVASTATPSARALPTPYRHCLWRLAQTTSRPARRSIQIVRGCLVRTRRHEIRFASHHGSATSKVTARSRRQWAAPFDNR